MSCTMAFDVDDDLVSLLCSAQGLTYSCVRPMNLYVCRWSDRPDCGDVYDADQRLEGHFCGHELDDIIGRSHDAGAAVDGDAQVGDTGSDARSDAEADRDAESGRDAETNRDAGVDWDAGMDLDAARHDAAEPSSDGGVRDATTQGHSDASAGIAGRGHPASVGYGARKSIIIDGLNTRGEWWDDTLLIRDAAGDDARFLGRNWCAHEVPWDYAAMHAAWDDENLYLGLQFVNITDVVDPLNFPGSEWPQIQNLDLVQFVAFNIVDGQGYSTGGDMWTKDQTFVGDDHPDFQLYFHSNFSQQGTFLGRWDGTRFVASANGRTSPTLMGMAGEFYAGTTLMGVDPHADDSSPGRVGAPHIDYILRGHSTAADTFFELQIPLALLGIDASRLDTGAIGVFAANGDGSAVDSVPDDPATRSTPGTTASNSPLEWDPAADDDAYSVPFAWVGTPR